jgi:hypothetical protein
MCNETQIHIAVENASGRLAHDGILRGFKAYSDPWS